MGREVGREVQGFLHFSFAIEGGKCCEGSDEDAEVGEGDEEGEVVHGYVAVVSLAKGARSCGFWRP